MKQNTLIKRRLLQIGFVSFIVFSTLLTFNRQALAYVLFPWKWSGTTVNYDPHTMGSGWIQIASDGRQQWNNVSPSPFTMLRNDGSANDVTLQSIDGDGGTLGRTYLYCGANLCSAAGQTVTRAIIQFDTVGIWHLDSSCMVPSNAFDARGVSAHEFGHFATISHTQSSNCSGTNPATMCGGIPRGSCAYRSLNSDDQAGLNAQYP